MNEVAKTEAQSQDVATGEDVDPLRARHPKVTDRQAELVDAVCLTGMNITAAAEKIDAERAWASKTLKKPHVLAYLDELTKAARVVLRARADATLGNLLSAKSDWIKLEAAREARKDSVSDNRGGNANTVNVQLNF